MSRDDRYKIRWDNLSHSKMSFTLFLNWGTYYFIEGKRLTSKFEREIEKKTQTNNIPYNSAWIDTIN